MTGRTPRSRFGLCAVLACVLSLTGFAGANATTEQHSATIEVLFQSRDGFTQAPTQARTVGQFLQERGIIPGPLDYVRPSSDTAISSGMTIEYDRAVPVRLATGAGVKTLMTAALDVGAFLEESGILLGRYDVVHPSLADPIVAGGTIAISHVMHWISVQRASIAQKTIRRLDYTLPPGHKKMLAPGRPGVRETTIAYTQIGDALREHVVASRVVRPAKMRIIAEGFTERLAAHSLAMEATAYSASCAGCDGYTASGRRAGHGIVAVDPRVIPLGTRLFIPGYGYAVAGDTGGAIRGMRIDLGFDSQGDALEFGRRTVKVYTLR